MKTKQMSAIDMYHTLAIADQIIRKNGVFLARRSFFYKNGKTDQGFAGEITIQLRVQGFTPTILEFGTFEAPFRGGAPIQKQSHFWVRFTI